MLKKSQQSTELGQKLTLTKLQSNLKIFAQHQQI